MDTPRSLPCSHSDTFDQKHAGVQIGLTSEPAPTPGTSNSNSNKRRKRPRKTKRKTRRKSRAELKQHRNALDDNSDSGNETHMEKLNDGSPSIIIQSDYAAFKFAKDAHSSETLSVFWTDGSFPGRSDSGHNLVPLSSPRSSSFSSDRSNSPSDAVMPPVSSSSSEKDSGSASVVYEDSSQPGGWVCKGFILAEVKSSEEAELHGINAGLELAFQTAEKDPVFKKKILIFTDCQGALRTVSEHLSNKGRKGPEILVPLINSLSGLWRLGAHVELRWVPGHMGVPGNMVADAVAKNATIYDKKSRGN